MLISWTTLGVFWFFTSIAISLIFWGPASVYKISFKKILIASALFAAICCIGYKKYDDKMIATEIQNVGII